METRFGREWPEFPGDVLAEGTGHGTDRKRQVKLWVAEPAEEGAGCR
jgi:hypothetical protein